MIFSALRDAWARIAASARPVAIPVNQPSTLGLEALEVALGEVGRGESGGNNHGPDVERYRRGRGPRGSWCAAFVSWCLEEGAEHLVDLSPVERSHGARQLWRRCVVAGRRVDRPLPGDIVLWRRGPIGGWQGHVGIVSRVDGAAFWSVEGNRGRFPSLVREFGHELGEDRLVGFARIGGA